MKFDSYSKIVLGLVHPRRFGTVMSLSAESHLVINTMMNTIVRKAISGAKKIARLKNNKAKEIKQKDIETSLEIFAPGELRKHVLSQIKGVMERFKKANDPKKYFHQENKLAGQMKREIKSTKDIKITDEAYVALSAALDYLIADVLELAGNDARDSGKKRITPKNIYTTIISDEEFSILFRLEKFVIPRTVEFTKKETKNRNNNNTKVLEPGRVPRAHWRFDDDLLSDIVLKKIVKDLTKTKGANYLKVNEFDDLVIGELNGVLRVFIENILNRVVPLYISHIGNPRNINKATPKLDFMILNHVLTKDKIYVPNVTETYYKKSVYISPRRFKAFMTYQITNYIRLGKLLNNKNFSIMSDDFVRALHIVTEHYLLTLIRDVKVGAFHRNNKTFKSKNIQLVRHVRKERA